MVATGLRTWTTRGVMSPPRDLHAEAMRRAVQRWLAHERYLKDRKMIPWRERRA